MKTALQILNRAYSKIQVKSAYTDLEENLINDGIDELNEMMWELEAGGLAIGWHDITSKDQVLSTPDWMNGMIINGLAIKRAPDFGYALDERVIFAYDKGLEIARKMLNKVPRIQYPDILPTGGAGSRWSGERYFTDANKNAIIGQSGNLTDDAGNTIKFDYDNNPLTNE